MKRFYKGFFLILTAALLFSACAEKDGESAEAVSETVESEEVIVIGKADDAEEPETVNEAEEKGTKETAGKEDKAATEEKEISETASEAEKADTEDKEEKDPEEKPEEETSEEKPEADTNEEKPEEEIKEEKEDPENKEVKETDKSQENAEDSENAEQQDAAQSAGTGFSKSEISDDIKARINGKSYAANCTVPYEDLRYLKVMYVNFQGQDCSGEIICNKAIADDLLDIFQKLYQERYQIDKIRLIDEYGADDDLSCADDNTSCFCFRNVEGSGNLSKHALGRAIDINPFYNPYVTYPNGKIRISPPGSEPYANRDSDFPHKIDKNDLAYKLFKAHGFTWGGDWKTLKDYQHFQKS